jgi:hypothetical protein
VQTELIAERVARNQATFRGANEELAESASEIAPDLRSAPFLCECPRTDCVNVVLVQLEEYERVRSHPRWFLVAPGHETCVVDDVAVARVLERHESFSVLEKVGTAGEVAESLDPRS